MPAKRILLVESQPDAAQKLFEGLSSLDEVVSVQVAASAEEALRALQAAPVDLLLADVVLPGISGLELMARFRTRNPAMRVILTSAVPDEALRSQVARSGADAFFFKPVELADILDATERLLGFVKTILPAELAAINDAQDTPPNTAQQLADLRFTLQAYSVLLLSPQGQVQARAGVLPNARIEAELIPHLLTARQASQRMGSLLGSPHSDDLLAVRGPNEHLYITGLDAGRCLVVVTKPLSKARAASLAEALEKTTASLRDLERPSTHNTNLKSESTDPQLEQLLEQAETRPTRLAADDYWQPAELSSLPQPGALSYEQAAQIGLLPKSSH